MSTKRMPAQIHSELIQTETELQMALTGLDPSLSEKISFFKDSDADGFGDFNLPAAELTCDPSLNLSGLVPNNEDVFPQDPTEWHDDDSDGYGNNKDVFPLDPTEWEDMDGDAAGGNSDFDDQDPSIGIPVPMELQISVPTDGQTFELPLVSGFSYNFSVDWGDGTTSAISDYSDPSKYHVYTSKGGYLIKLTGLVQKIDISGATHKDQFISIRNLGATGLRDLSSAFKNATQLRFVGGGNTSYVTDMSSTFQNSTGLNVDTSTWDTQRVQDMSFMFENNNHVKVQTAGWNTANVTAMNEMFGTAHTAEPNTENWDVSNVLTMENMFFDARSAEPKTSGWNTSNVTNMAGMFGPAYAAEPDVTNWNVSNVQDMSSFANEAYAASLDVSNWDLSNVTDMTGAFNETYSLKIDLSKVETIPNQQNMLRNIKKHINASPPSEPLIQYLGLSQEMDNLVHTMDLSNPLQNMQPGPTINERYEYSSLSAGNASKLLLLLVDPVKGITTATNGYLAVNQRCIGAFDTEAAVSNLEDSVTPPNNVTVYEHNVRYCEDTDNDLIENLDDPDVDGDGTPNESDADIDGDGLSNVVERSVGSNPFFADTDGDGTPDNMDAFPVNPYMSVDGDGDGIGAAYDENDSVADAQIPFISIWRTTSADETITLPLKDDPALSITVDWGDASSDSITTWNQLEATHTFVSAGDHVVKITGTLPGFGFANVGDKAKLIAVPLLGNLGFNDLSGGFHGTTNLEFVGSGDLSAVTDMSNFLSGAGNSTNRFSVDAHAWNTFNATDMSHTFASRYLETPNIEKLPTSNVTNLDYAFVYSRNISLDLNAWDTSNVTSLNRTFSSGMHNHFDLRDWNTSNVLSMEWMNAYHRFTKLEMDDWEHPM